MNNLYYEVNFDGIPAIYHNYGGLAHGNLASKNFEGTISYPKQAALQALNKAKSLYNMGIMQAVLPPQIRPDFTILAQLGYMGDKQEILTQLQESNPQLLVKLYSSAAMWTANAATIVPSCDSKSGKLCIVPANLNTNLHRMVEADKTYKILKQIFSGDLFQVFNPLPQHKIFADEGAANHMRLSGDYNQKGLHIFVYGNKPKKFPARQTFESCKSIARLCGIEKNSLFIQQDDDVIDKGVFHNDVIATSNENILFYHENAYSNNAIQEIKQKYKDKNYLQLLEIKEKDLSVEDAVKTYFFNCQIITLPNKSMAIIAPEEAKKYQNLYDKILQDSNNTINELYFFNLKQSMQNGGGPACLRLRILMNEQEITQVQNNANIFLNNTIYQSLLNWIDEFYSEKLEIKDLFDIKLYNKTIKSLTALEKIINLKIIDC